MRRLGVAHLTALELAPADLVRQAAAGFGAVGLRLHPAHPGGVAFDAAPGSAGQRELARALDGEGVAVADIEFVPLVPDIDIPALEPLLASGAALGAASLTVSGDDPDAGRLADAFAQLCLLARPFGIRIDIEFMRWRPVARYGDAAAVVERAGQSNAGVLVDLLHLDRSGGTLDEVDLRPGGPVRAVQLCDAPAARPVSDADTIREAREGRLVPGEGALPVAALLARLAPDVALSVECPNPALPTGLRLRRAADAARAMLEREDAQWQGA